MGLEFEIDEDIYYFNDMNNLDYRLLYKAKSNINNEIDSSNMNKIEYKASLTPKTSFNTKKIIMFSASKKIVFGFDKVENLLDPILLDEDQESNRDILREINNLNYEGGANSFRYLNFT